MQKPEGTQFEVKVRCIPVINGTYHMHYSLWGKIPEVPRQKCTNYYYHKVHAEPKKPICS